MLRASQPRYQYHLTGKYSVEGMGPTLAVKGTTARKVCEAYVEQEILAHTLCIGQVVVTDNLPVHKGHKVGN